MSSTNEPEQKAPQPPRPESATSESQNAAEQTPITKVDVLHAFVEEYKARDDQNSYMYKRNFRLGVVTAVLLFAYTTITALQWCALMETNRMSRESFEKTQRASINLGLPDGKLAEFLPGPSGPQIVLYFRNYGVVTAQNTIIEFWPITLFPGVPSSTIHVPTPKEVGSFGSSMPPQFFFPISKIYTESSVNELDTGKRFLHIVGRIRYNDQHRAYCESFMLVYVRKPVSQFRLLSSGSPMEELSFCTGREYTVFLGESSVATGLNAQKKNTE